MSKVTIGVIFTCLAAGALQFGFSQVINPKLQGNWCGTELLMQKEFEKNPESKKLFEEHYRNMGAEINSLTYKKKSGTVQIIPVVVHVLHYNGDGNISKAQIEDGIAVLNRDYARLNADTSSTRTVFKPYAANPEFEFRLAKIDPNGNCTEGIVRVNTDLTYNADDSKGIKSTASGGSSPWPQNKYLNIWLVNTIESGGGPGIILGYAILPGGWGWPSSYGAVIRNDSWGTIGTAIMDGRTATHEVGHCLGLLHTFDSGCGSNCSSSGDYVCDTPPAAADTYGCNTTQNTCSNDMSGSSPFSSDVVDQIENYLSYDACQNMFSLGQKSEMKYTVSAFSQLTNLVSSANLTATGTNTGYVPSLCAPVADFYSSTVVTCTGMPVQFTDASYNGAATSRTWSFAGGTPSTATDSTPNVVFYNPGTYTVSLTVSNTSGSNTKTKTSYITVLPSPLKTMPYQEDFETAAIPGTEWTIVNDDNNKTWGLATTAGFASDSSLKMNNFGYATGNMDEIISPTIDMSVIASNATINFKVSYVQRSATSSDMLRLLVSNDCGKTWAPRWSKSGANLATAAIQSATAFTPSDTSKWKAWTGITVSSAYYVTNFRFKFEFTSGGGNNLYIDDINLTGTLNKIPVLVSPPNFSSGQSPAALTLDWKAVSGVDSYQVEVDTAIGFFSPVSSATYTYISSSDSNADTQHGLSNLDGLRDYFWRVRSVITGTPSPWSATWRFSTDTAAGTAEPVASPLQIYIFPNPLQKNSTAVLSGRISGKITIEIIDVLGKSIFIKDYFSTQGGEHAFSLPALTQPGIYLIKISDTGEMITRKVLVE